MLIKPPGQPLTLSPPSPRARGALVVPEEVATAEAVQPGGDVVTLSMRAPASFDPSTLADAPPGLLTGWAMMLERLFGGEAHGEQRLDSVASIYDPRRPVFGSGAQEARAPIYDPRRGVFDSLRRADRVVLAEAYQLALESDLAPAEVDALAVDLARYRLASADVSYTERLFVRLASASMPAAPPPAEDESADVLAKPVSAYGLTRAVPAQSEREQTRAKTLTLLLSLQRALGPELTADDEAVARAVLSSRALEDTRLDPEFVRALLTPGREPEPTVRLPFLHLLVLRLSPTHADGARDLEARFEHRDAHVRLVQSVRSVLLAFARSTGSEPSLPRPSARATAPQAEPLASTREMEVDLHFAGTPAQGEAADDTSTSAPRAHVPLAHLRDEDHALLGRLRGAARTVGVDAREIRALAEALGVLREREALAAAALRPHVLAPQPGELEAAPAADPRMQSASSGDAARDASAALAALWTPRAHASKRRRVRRWSRRGFRRRIERLEPARADRSR